MEALGQSMSRASMWDHVECVDMQQIDTCRYEQIKAADVYADVRPARVMLLFSGGIDSTVLAIMAHHSLPPCEPIDLATVCFDAGRSPDRLAALDALDELACLAPHREWRLVLVDATLADVDAQRARCDVTSTSRAGRCVDVICLTDGLFLLQVAGDCCKWLEIVTCQADA